VEGISKAVNLGNLLRSAHAFGASFVFTIGADAGAMDTIADVDRPLPPYHPHSDRLFAEPCDRGRDRHVRPHALPRTLRLATGG